MRALTHRIVKEMMSTGMRFKNPQIYLPLLLFADDGLMPSQSPRETESMLQVLIKASERCGLKINKEKGVIMIYNYEEIGVIKQTEGIPVEEETKNLGEKSQTKRTHSENKGRA